MQKVPSATHSPQSNFYQWVNSEWLTHARIPDDAATWSSFDDLRVQSQRCITDAIASIDREPSTSDCTLTKIATLYDSCMDTAAIELLRETAISKFLKEVDSVHTMSGLFELFGRFLRRGVPAPLRLDVDSDPGDPSRIVMYILQSGVFFPDAKFYLADEYAELRGKYRSHIAFCLDRIGAPEEPEMVDQIVALESFLARHHVTKAQRRKMRKQWCSEPYRALRESVDIPWDSLLAGAQVPGKSAARIVNAQPTYLDCLPRAIANFPLETWKAWSRWKLFTAFAPYLFQEVSQAHEEFIATHLLGARTTPTQHDRALNLTEFIMGEALGRMYIEKFCNETIFSMVHTLCEALQEEWDTTLRRLPWMSEDTRGEALEKLSRMLFLVGCPDTWRSYDQLIVTPGRLVDNVVHGSEFAWGFAMESIGKAPDRREWTLFPQSVSASYHQLRNRVILPAAILQPPIFDLQKSRACMFGALGSLISHEICHAFDDRGCHVDAHGSISDWWSKKDLESFAEAQSRVFEQFDGVPFPEDPSLTVNGSLTLGEGLADIVGIQVALRAWERFEPVGTPLECIPRGSMDEFFSAWGTLWRRLVRPQALRTFASRDPHPPAELRCNQALRNCHAFLALYQVTPGDPMWQEPNLSLRV